MKIKNSRRGFTINEVLITTGIIASLTVIAVPNFLRMKMNVNMELVKQDLRNIGLNMNDLFNKNQQFPSDINQLGNTGEEVAITASLFSIDKKDYTTNGYKPSANKLDYQLTTCPKTGKMGIAGDRCFVLTSMGIVDTPPVLAVLDPPPVPEPAPQPIVPPQPEPLFWWWPELDYQTYAPQAGVDPPKGATIETGVLGTAADYIMALSDAGRLCD